MTKERDSVMGEEEVSQEEEVVLTDQEHLGLLLERHRDLKKKVSQAEVKRKQSKDGKERLRLKHTAEALEEECLGLEVEIAEIGQRVKEAEREEAIEKAEALRVEAETILQKGIIERKRVLGYLRSMWVSFPKVWNLRQEYRLKREAYYQLCREKGITGSPIRYQQFEDIQMFSGKTLPNPQDTIHAKRNFLTWLDDMCLYGLGRISSVPAPSKKDRWPE